MCSGVTEVLTILMARTQFGAVLLATILVASVAALQGCSAEIHAPVERVVILADPGVDDTMAILLAVASPELRVEGIVVTYGNNGNTTLLGLNALRILGVANRTDIPVFLGSSDPLTHSYVENGGYKFHGANGLGNIDVPLPENARIQEESGVDFIVRMCRQHPGEITIVSLSPLTTIAMAYKTEPRIAVLARRFVMMGGTVRETGNVHPLGEANVFNDAMGAHVVFTAGWNVTMAPLDVTMATRLTEEYLDGFASPGNACGRLITDITRFYLNAYRTIVGVNFMPVHDSSAIVAMLRPDLYTGTTVYVDVETEGLMTSGTTVADFNGNFGKTPQTHLLMTVDADGVRDLLKQRIATLP